MAEMIRLLSEDENAFDENAAKISDVSHDFGYLAYQCVQEFDRKFSADSINADTVANDMLDFFAICIQKGMKLGTACLHQKFDIDILEEDYTQFSTLNEHAFFSVIRTFMACFFIPYKELVEEYGDSEENKLLYDTGKRWVGGGIGISGAIGGAIQAELLNAGSDLLRNGVNALFAKGNQAVFRSEVRKLLADCEVRRQLRNSLYETVCATCIGALEWLNLNRQLIFSVEDMQLFYEMYDEARDALYESDDIANEIETGSDLFIRYAGITLTHFQTVPFSVQMMDDLLPLDIPGFPMSAVYEQLKPTGRESFFREKWFEFVSDAVHEVQKRPIQSAQDIADIMEDIHDILEGTPFDADAILAGYSEEYHSRSIWEAYCAAKKDPFSKKSRDFWMNPDPIAEYLTIYFFTEERFPKAEELINMMLAKNVPAAFAVAAEWEIGNHSHYAKAKSYLEQGIRFNSPGCIFRMATVLLNGYWKTSISTVKGRAYLDKAVRMEYPDAINYLCASLRRNSFGYESDTKRFTWCQDKLKHWKLPKEYFTKHPDDYQDSLLWQLL